jgi:hypothetical protein
VGARCDRGRKAGDERAWRCSHVLLAFRTAFSIFYMEGISLMDGPGLLLSVAARRMPAERREWGKAMLAELAQIRRPSTRWRFALGCVRVAVFPPRKVGLLQAIMSHKMESLIAPLGSAALASLLLALPFERGGVWLARAYVIYGLVFLLIPAFFFANIALLGAVVWDVAGRARGQQPRPGAPAFLRRWGRLAVEIAFGLINPMLYLVILNPALPDQSFPGLLPDAQWWGWPLKVSAWILLTAFWTLRIFGAAIDPGSRVARVGMRALLMASLACLLVYIVKDAWLLGDIHAGTNSSDATQFTLTLMVLRLCPLYLIPAVLLWDYLRSTARPEWQAGQASDERRAFFLMPNRAARVAVAAVVGAMLVTFALAARRRSEAGVRELVSDHRELIRAAAARYGVDPRLIAAIVYVTHRDQLSPFRDALERLTISAWARNMRREIGTRPPDEMEKLGTDENPLLNRALDISVGLAQIKPRTAQTASVLATGRTPDTLPEPEFFTYRDVEPVGDGWTAAARPTLISPIPVPAERHVVADTLLDARSNLETCALILALYQNQWEATNRDWSIRERPDVLATLYQIGFARSKPHSAPRSNAFGSRVSQVYEEPWLTELFDTAPRSSK